MAPRSIFEPVSGQRRFLTDQRATGEHAASLAASWCRRRLGRGYAQSAWQMLAAAPRLGVIRHGLPEAWAAGAVIALARVSGLIGTGRALGAQQVADEFGVTLGALAVTEPRACPSAPSRSLRAAPARPVRGLTSARPACGRHTLLGSKNRNAQEARSTRGRSTNSIADTAPRAR